MGLRKMDYYHTRLSSTTGRMYAATINIYCNTYERFFSSTVASARPPAGRAHLRGRNIRVLPKIHRITSGRCYYIIVLLSTQYNMDPNEGEKRNRRACACRQRACVAVDTLAFDTTMTANPDRGVRGEGRASSPSTNRTIIIF